MLCSGGSARTSFATRTSAWWRPFAASASPSSTSTAACCRSSRSPAASSSRVTSRPSMTRACPSRAAPSTRAGSTSSSMSSSRCRAPYQMITATCWRRSCRRACIPEKWTWRRRNARSMMSTSRPRCAVSAPRPPKMTTMTRTRMAPHVFSALNSKPAVGKWGTRAKNAETPEGGKQGEQDGRGRHPFQLQIEPPLIHSFFHVPGACAAWAHRLVADCNSLLWVGGRFQLCVVRRITSVVV
mmetsp:Transcript_1205/g.4274  ORF Transcript_1205/g.4274 Transcript_1205/m.4274 type:complete len:241 (+) Transcript_1205:1021-1743(+)